jgi:hypothetical protein
MEEKCCLEKRCKKEHLIAPEKLTRKLVRIGTLFGGQGVCMWCSTHLEMMTRPQAMDSEIESLRKKYPGWAKVIDEVGIDKMRFELRCQWLEVEPDPILRPVPTSPDVSVFGIRID